MCSPMLRHGKQTTSSTNLTALHATWL